MYSLLKIRLKAVILCLFTIIFLAVLIIFPSYVSNGVKEGLTYSVSLLIPSLFPFMVLSSFAIRSGFSDIAGRPLKKVTKFLFGLPESCSAAILLSLVGGFPVGARCVKLLYSENKINARQAGHMMMFCVCSGPAFLITAIGAIMLNNIYVGIILYISQIIACGTIGIVSRFFSFDSIKAENQVADPHKKTTGKTLGKSSHEISIISSFISSCSDGASAIIGMTAMVVIFTLFINTFEQIGIISFFSNALSFFGISGGLKDTVIPILLEVTGACKKICSNSLPIWVLSFAVGFGGFCVHFQIFGILEGVPINKLKYLLLRFVNAVLSSVITYIICIFYNPVYEVFAPSEISDIEISSSTVVGSLALIFMSAVFLMSLRKAEGGSVLSNKSA